MITLTSDPVAPLLNRLFAEADAATSPAIRSFTSEERTALTGSKTQYLDLYGRLKDLWLPVSRETGELLYMLVRAIGARTVVEFGTSFGISSLYIAAALRDNGGGRLISSEFEPGKIARAQQNLEEASLADLVEIRAGDAMETLARDLPEAVDLLLLDGAKALYPDVFNLVEEKLRKGALILADDAEMCPEYLERIRASKGPYLSLPFAGDIELSIKLS
ncbi:O-methyltransferase [Rhizobium miluonense]|uniref:Methyltransferase domain-containing protein n=1 Tax=Rhizobium miluonense TaxID=411945 RepID=A0A1C3XAM0_9HYPH|nr:class I SAM-dependent methyltransferase [Rhizobium miluonense]SCB49024.1 Methyltransferase domain-containing protein [Rhizobium miluonense]